MEKSPTKIVVQAALFTFAYFLFSLILDPSYRVWYLTLGLGFLLPIGVYLVFSKLYENPLKKIVPSLFYAIIALIIIAVSPASRGNPAVQQPFMLSDLVSGVTLEGIAVLFVFYYIVELVTSLITKKLK